MSKLSLNNELRALDTKDRDFYDSLDDDEKKKFSPYLMLRYSANVESQNPHMIDWYLHSTNERVNKNFFDINTTKHKKLQWLVCTTASPGAGSQRHYWTNYKKKESNNKAVKFLKEIYPTFKDDEIELLARLNDKKDIRDLARQHGWDEKRIKAEL
jgi:hypothetical protein